MLWRDTQCCVLLQTKDSEQNKKQIKGSRKERLHKMTIERIKQCKKNTHYGIIKREHSHSVLRRGKGSTVQDTHKSYSNRI